MGNVKLGKYTASQEEMASEDYSEEEWEKIKKEFNGKLRKFVYQRPSIISN